MVGKIDGGRKQAGTRRPRRVGFPGGEVIEGEFGVGKEAVPFGEGEMDVNGGKDGREVVFERTSAPFGNIRTVIVRGNVLDVRTRDGRVKALSEVGGGFVISGEVGGRVTTSSKEGEDGFVGGDVSGGGAGRRGEIDVCS